jgi:segregation and condensation protein B
MEEYMTEIPHETPDIEEPIINEEQNIISPEPEEAGLKESAEGQNETSSSLQDSLSIIDNGTCDITAESVIEAVLFASDEPLSDARLAGIVEVGVKQVRQYIQSLNDKYEANNSAFRIEQIASGYQMLTLSTYNHWLQKLLRVRSEGKLSPAALETLAIIAYKQPVMRADIEAIRGVAVGEVIRSLMSKGLVKIVGRAEVLGRPMLYGTTKKFLEIFGLNSLKDLPKVEELKKPD